MQTVHGRVIEGEVLEIDDKHFSDCLIRNCIVEYHGTEFILERTQMSGCRYVFYGRARGTIHFLQSVGLLPDGANQWIEFEGLIQ